MKKARDSCRKPYLGSSVTADRVAQRVIETVPAYRRQLEDLGVPLATSFEALPVIDKAGYVRRHAFADLLCDNVGDTFTIFRSAGSTGHPAYWPQLKSSYADAQERLGRALDVLFDLSQQRTLAVVGLALGSWIGGDLLSWSLKNVAMAAPYPFAVFSPGNRHEEVIETLHKAAELVDQVLLVCCPSAIGHLKLLADQTGKPLPEARMRYLVLGEPFPEQMRAQIEASAGGIVNGVRMASLYGSADTGILGYESPASIQLRKLCATFPGVADALGLDGTTPHFFHLSEADTYLEVVEGELCVTRWQGIPLVRYNLHDAAALFDFPAVVETLSRFDLTGTAKGVVDALASAAGLLPPDIVAVSGRADTVLNLSGTKISEAMLDEAVHAPDIISLLTGAYEAEVVLEQGRQRLGLSLELRSGATVSDALVQRIYPALVEALGRAQPEFRDDWQNVYRRWDDDPDRRILKLDLATWPAISNDVQQGIKKHGIVT